MATRVWLGTTSSAWNTAANWSGNTLPANGDAVVITGSNPIAGYDASGVALAELTIHDYTATIGSADAPLELDSDVVSVSTSGVAYLKFTDSGMSRMDVHKTARVSEGNTALDLAGDMGNATLNVFGNSRVRLRADVLWCYVHDEAAAVDVRNDDTAGGSNTVTSLVSRGLVSVSGAGTAVTNLYAQGGEVRHSSNQTLTLVQAEAGATVWVSDAAVTTANLYGGTLVAMDNIDGRTIATLNLRAGGRLERGSGWSITNLADGKQVLLGA